MKPWWYAAGLILGLAVTQASEAVYTHNVVIVLDGSGSMQQAMRETRVAKMDAAKTALKAVLATLPADTHVGLLVFTNGRPGWVFPLGPRRDADLSRAIDAVQAGGGTPLGTSMKLAADRLLEAREAQYGYGSYRLLLVTDGQATDGTLTTDYAPLILARGIVMDVIGVDMAQDHILATRANSYRRANDAEALRRAIQEIFAEVGRTGAGGAGDEAFAELAGFPAEAAMAVLSALAAPGNQPIGSQPSAAAAPGAPAVAPPAPMPPAAPAPTPGTGSPPPRRRPPWMLLAALGIILTIIVKAAAKGRRAAGR